MKAPYWVWRDMTHPVQYGIFVDFDDSLRIWTTDKQLADAPLTWIVVGK